MAMEKVTGVLYLYLPANAEIDNRQQAAGDDSRRAEHRHRTPASTQRPVPCRDTLTGLANRRLMALELTSPARASALASPARWSWRISIFPNYNDLYGHAAGDEILADSNDLEEIRRIDLGARLAARNFY